jgi:hypothetical protein
VTTEPEVLGVIESRKALTSLVRHTQADPNAETYIGSHRKAQAVLINAQRWDAVKAIWANLDPSQLEDAMNKAELDAAVIEVTAGHRMAGLEITDENVAMVEAMLTGELTGDQAREQIRAKYDALAAERNRAAS